jgi:hypothetical protein
MSRLLSFLVFVFTFTCLHGQLNHHFDPIDFDGSKTLEVGKTVLSSTFSFSAEVKIEASDQWRHLIEIGAREHQWNCPFRLEVGDEGQWYIAMGDGNSYTDQNVYGNWKYGDWIRILFVYDDGQGKLYENGKLILSFNVSQDITTVAGSMILGSFKGNSRFFEGQMKNAQLVSEVLSPEVIFYHAGGGDSQPTKGQKICAWDLGGLQSHTLSFRIKPMEETNTWSNFMHFGSRDEQRQPSLWLYPGQTRLHYRQATGAGPNTGFDPARQLPLGKWTLVTITWTISDGQSNVKIYYDDQMVLNDSPPQKPIMGLTSMYLSSPWANSSKVLIDKTVIFDRAMSPREVAPFY